MQEPSVEHEFYGSMEKVEAALKCEDEQGFEMGFVTISAIWNPTKGA